MTNSNDDRRPVAEELSTSMMFGGFNLPANVARHLAVAAWAAMLAAAPAAAPAALVDEETGS